MRAADLLAARSLDWIVPQWGAPSSVQGFVTTRNGPAGSGKAFEAGPARLDAIDARARSTITGHREFLQRLLPSAPIWLEQVHGREVVRIDHATLDRARREPPVADAAVTRLPDVPLAIRVADCLPVFLTDASGSVIGAAHAGWRGLSLGVLESTIAALDVEPASLRAWLGPAIGPEGFEVGADVVEAFVRADADAMRCFAPLREHKWLADLPQLARRRLAACGVEHVAGGDLCTWRDRTRFFSWRRDRTAQRMAAVLWRTARA